MQSIFGFIRDFNLPLWVALVTALAIVIMALVRAGFQLQKDLRELTAPIYRHHPSSDKGIDVNDLAFTGDIGPAQTWRMVLRVLSLGAPRVLVVLRSPVRYMYIDYTLPVELQKVTKDSMGQKVTTARLDPESQSLTTFLFSLPKQEPPIDMTLYLSTSEPPQVASIEWHQ